MSLLAKVGSFNIDTAKTVGQTQSITDVGFQPKIVMFWWSGSTATGDEVAGGDINIGFGAAIDSTHRFCNMGCSLDGLASSDSMRSQNGTEIIRCYTNTSTIDGIADFSSQDADGFTIIIDNQFDLAYRISYLALGGTDLTNVYIGNFTSPLVTGEFDKTDAGFQPDALLLFQEAVTSANTTSDWLIYSIGMATSSSNQGVVGAFSQDNTSTMYTRGYGFNNEVGAIIAQNLIYERLSFVSFLSTGFRLNLLETHDANVNYYICLKGGQYSVGDITTRTDGNDIAETVGFQPAALLFASANRELSTQDTPTTNSRLSIGAATSTSNRAVQAISDENGIADSETAHANYDSAVYAFVQDDATVGLMDLKSIESDGFTCVMDDADPSACWVTYLAIGASESEQCVNVVTEMVEVDIDATAVITEICEP